MAPRTMHIHQFYTGSAVTEAVADSMLFIQSLLADWNIPSEILADGSFKRLAPQAEDLLLIHQSGGDAGLAALNNMRCRKALVCHDGCAPFAELRRSVEAAIAISPSGARALRERGFPTAPVIPLVKDFAALRSAPHERVHYHDERAVFRLLSRGGILPDQGLDELVDCIALARSIDGIPIELVLIGDRADDPAGFQQLEARIRRLGIERHVRIAGAVNDAELFGRYRSSAVCIWLGERGGLILPLLEAMAFDLPIVAYRSGGAADTLAGAGITIERREARAIREALERLHRDRAFRRDIIRGQRARLLCFSRERVAAELAGWLQGLGVAVGEPTARAVEKARLHYVIEGPFETSYSLASVNRNLAASLEVRDGCAGYIEPSEGDPGYCVDTEAVARLPRAITELVRPAPLAAERVATIRNMYPCRPNGMLGDLRLVHLAWEESALPLGLAGLMNLHLDGVLVPSEYCKRAVRDSGVRLPIAVVGHGIDHLGVPPPAPTDRTTRSQPSPEAPFVFLNISAGVDRKGVEELVTAYALAFSRRDPVLLVIKTYHNEQNLVDWWVARVTDGMPDAPAIQVIFDELHPQEIDVLYARADAIVLPARGEGFNLPAAEAMARELPLIVTRHSGHLDFCNDANCILVDCRYELSTSYLQIPDSVWARPSLQDLAEALKTVYREARTAGSAAHSRALRAPRDVAQMRWSAVAERVDRFVRSLEERPVVTRKLRLAWVSAVNPKDEVAESSQRLREHFDAAAFDIGVFAPIEPAPRTDPPGLRRTWRSGDSDLAALQGELVSGGFDAVFFHHDFGRFATQAFAALLDSLNAAGVDTYVMLHATIDPEANSEDRALAAALSGCTRVFVRSVAEINALRSVAAPDNLVLVPDGVGDREPPSAAALRATAGIARCDPVIGVLASGRSELEPLLHGFLLLSRRHPAAFLLIVAGCLRDAERRRLDADIAGLGLAAQVRIVGEYRDGEEAASLLAACDAVVCSNEIGADAAGAAVRLALASGRPVTAPPSLVLGDMSDLVYRLPGDGAIEIAEGLATLLDDGDARDKLVRRQRRWIERRGWAAQAERIGNIVVGCCEERLGAELRPASPPAFASEESLTLPPDGVLGAVHLAQAEALLRRRRLPASCETPAEPAVAAGVAATAPRRRPAFRRERARKDAICRADSARDARDWTRAARYYRLALQHKPDMAAIWVQYGHALKESGNFAAAEAAYRRALALAPAVADSHLQLGHLLKMRRQGGAAVLAYLKALTIDAHFAPALAELAALGWGAARIGRALLRSEYERSADCRSDQILPVSAALPASPSEPGADRLRAARHIAFPRFLAQWPELAVEVPAVYLRAEYAALTGAGILRADRHPTAPFCRGPYLNLPGGRYRVEAVGSAGAGAEYRMQMVHSLEGRAKVICERSYRQPAPVRGTIADLGCACTTELHDLETVITVTSPAAEFSLASIRISADRLMVPG